jgi:hypothetical protein
VDLSSLLSKCLGKWDFISSKNVFFANFEIRKSLFFPSAVRTERNV